MVAAQRRQYMGINALPREPMPGIVKAMRLAAHCRGVCLGSLLKLARAPSCGRPGRPRT